MVVAIVDFTFNPSPLSPEESYYGCCAPPVAKMEILRKVKDISTVRREPQRLWEWARIATEIAKKFV